MVHNVCLAHVASASLHDTQVRPGPPSVPPPHSAVSHLLRPSRFPPSSHPGLHTRVAFYASAFYTRPRRARRVRGTPARRVATHTGATTHAAAVGRNRRCRPQAPSAPQSPFPLVTPTCSQLMIRSLEFGVEFRKAESFRFYLHAEISSCRKSDPRPNSL